MNVSNLELILVQKISNSTSTLDTLIYSKALQELKTGTVTVVDLASQLPTSNPLLAGHLFYAKDKEMIYFVNAGGVITALSPYALGELFTWGRNSSGELGDATTTNRSSPGSVSGSGSNWKTICFSKGGYGSTAAGIKTDGTLWTWGPNSSGQLGTGNTTGRSSPGTTVGCGTNWCAITVSASSMAAIKTDGSLWTWGANTCGMLGDGTATNRSSPGTVAGGGTNWSNVSMGSGGGYGAFTVATKTDGTMWSWGANTSSILGDCNTNTSRSSPGTTTGGHCSWVSVSAGTRTAAAIKCDGTLWTWGDNGNGARGQGNTNVGGSSVQESVFNQSSNWCLVSMGGNNFGAAIRTDGTLWMWGRSNEGQTGGAIGASGGCPGQVSLGSTNWCYVNAGQTHTVAIKTDGTIWTWGANSCGQLGDGTTTTRSSPVSVLGGGNTWCTAAAGGQSTAAIKTTY